MCVFVRVCVVESCASDRAMQRDDQDRGTTESGEQGRRRASRLCVAVEPLSSAASAKATSPDTSPAADCRRRFGQHRQVRARF